MDEFSKIVLSTFGPFIGYHQGLLACINSVFKRVLKVFRLFYNITKLRKHRVE